MCMVVVVTPDTTLTPSLPFLLHSFFMWECIVAKRALRSPPGHGWFPPSANRIQVHACGFELTQARSTGANNGAFKFSGATLQISVAFNDQHSCSGIHVWNVIQRISSYPPVHYLARLSKWICSLFEIHLCVEFWIVRLAAKQWTIKHKPTISTAASKSVVLIGPDIWMFRSSPEITYIQMWL